MRLTGKEPSTSLTRIVLLLMTAGGVKNPFNLRDVPSNGHLMQVCTHMDAYRVDWHPHGFL